jgi:hypothetical protein
MEYYWGVVNREIIAPHFLFDKYVGDKCIIMCFMHENDGISDVLERIKRFCMHIKSDKGLIDRGVKVAIGCNLQDGIVGNVGSKTRMNYTAIGVGYDGLNKSKENNNDAVVALDVRKYGERVAGVFEKDQRFQYLKLV